ncbi:hypothetical protein Tco_1351180 [Tanacetum coccineum]
MINAVTKSSETWEGAVKRQDYGTLQAPSGGVTDWYQSQGYREPGRISSLPTPMVILLFDSEDDFEHPSQTVETSTSSRYVSTSLTYRNS